MTFEFINIVERFRELKAANQKAVLATVVHVNGSSYRRPGVQMLIGSNGKMYGAVSGGCVEKEVQRQAQSVLENGVSKVMTYDGRYRLGCEGMLYILLESFDPSNEFLEHYAKGIKNRSSIKILSKYELGDVSNAAMFSRCSFEGGTYFPVNKAQNVPSDAQEALLNVTFELAPRFRLVIVGSEHDSIQLSSMAAQMGWEVIVVASATNPKTLEDFPGAMELQNVEVEHFDMSIIDQQTALILMTHSFSRDLHFLTRMTELNPVYFGILGPVKRREQLLNEIMEKLPELDLGFFEKLNAPAGLNIGAETPQEIALSVLSEIMTVRNNETASPLKNISGHIHERANLPGQGSRNNS